MTAVAGTLVELGSVKVVSLLLPDLNGAFRGGFESRCGHKRDR